MQWYSNHFTHAVTARSASEPPHYRGLTITLRHTTSGRTPLGEWSARRWDLYLTTHKTRETFMSRLSSNPQSQQATGHRTTR